LDTTEQRRLADPVLRARLAVPLAEPVALPLTLLGQLLRLSAALIVWVAVFKLSGQASHTSAMMPNGLFVRVIQLTVPGLAASLAAYALYRPWNALVAILALMPVYNAAYVSWQVGNLQVILQTIFVLAVAAGAITSTTAARSLPWIATGRIAAGRRTGFTAFRFAEVAAAGFVGIAVLSTVASTNVTLSSTILLHGILEPIALGALVIYMRPSRRDLVMLCVALGLAIAIGTVLNIVQTLPTASTFAAMQANRLEFARASFYNVGLFAVAAATIIPLGVAAFAARRSLQLPLWATATIAVSFGLGLAGLFLSFSKSAWLAAAFAIVLVMVLIIKTWRRRIALVFASAVISSILIPWPALFLQVAPAVNAEYRTVMVSLEGETRFDSWNPETLAGRGSLTERFYAVDAGVRMALTNPIFGVGLDQFGPNYWNPAYRPVAAKDALDHAHSFFPEIAAELGLIAAVFAFVIYAAALWAMLRIYRRTKDQLTRILAAGLAAAIVAWLVVATAFGCFIYRPTLDLSSDVVASVVIVAAAIALARLVDAEKRLPFAEATRSLYG
jgi:hypothetical protein